MNPYTGTQTNVWSYFFAEDYLNAVKKARQNGEDSMAEARRVMTEWNDRRFNLGGDSTGYFISVLIKSFISLDFVDEGVALAEMPPVYSLLFERGDAIYRYTHLFTKSWASPFVLFDALSGKTNPDGVDRFWALMHRVISMSAEGAFRARYDSAWQVTYMARNLLQHFYEDEARSYLDVLLREGGRTLVLHLLRKGCFEVLRREYPSSETEPVNSMFDFDELPVNDRSWTLLWSIFLGNREHFDADPEEFFRILFLESGSRHQKHITFAMAVLFARGWNFPPRSWMRLVKQYPEDFQSMTCYQAAKDAYIEGIMRFSELDFLCSVAEADDTLKTFAGPIRFYNRLVCRAMWNREGRLYDIVRRSEVKMTEIYRTPGLHRFEMTDPDLERCMKKVRWIVGNCPKNAQETIMHGLLPLINEETAYYILSELKDFGEAFYRWIRKLPPRREVVEVLACIISPEKFEEFVKGRIKPPDGNGLVGSLTQEGIRGRAEENTPEYVIGLIEKLALNFKWNEIVYPTQYIKQCVMIWPEEAAWHLHHAEAVRFVSNRRTEEYMREVRSRKDASGRYHAIVRLLSTRCVRAERRLLGLGGEKECVVNEVAVFYAILNSLPPEIQDIIMLHATGTVAPSKKSFEWAVVHVQDMLGFDPRGANLLCLACEECVVFSEEKKRLVMQCPA